jgi:FAD dependent oxidoreductase
MIRKLLIPLFIFIASYCQAEPVLPSGGTIKTDVLVIGGGACGVAAAIQSARSKVKTLLVEPGPWLGGSMTMGGMCILDANRDLPSGVWGEFRRKVTEYYHNRLGYDTSKNAVLRFEPYVGAEILRKITDTVKNLTVKLKTNWMTVKKDGTGWDVTIMVNKEVVKIEAKVVIDGTENGEVAERAGTQFTAEQSNANQKITDDVSDITWIAILKDYGRNADKTIAKPEGYNPAWYTYFQAKDVKQMLKSVTLPNDKFMINWPEGYSQAEQVRPENKQELYKLAKLRTLGLVYYMQTKFGYRNLGLDEEFGTPDHLPPIPYIKETRHVKGAVRMVRDDILKPYDRESKLYRTSIGIGENFYDNSFVISYAAPTSEVTVQYSPPYSIPLGAIVVKDLDNILVTEKAISVAPLVNINTLYPSVQMTLGQGVGATAAYCAFFKTTTKHLTVRTIQGEILDYKGYLLPFTDVPQNDPHWRAIQQVGETGLLKGIQKVNGNAVDLHFEPNDTVRTEEVKPILNEIYTRAFIWFRQEKTGEKLTLGNLLYFISDYTLTDKTTMEGTIKKLWKPIFKLPGEWDGDRPVTRLEFAVLVNKYLNPFAKTVDMSGRMVN